MEKIIAVSVICCAYNQENYIEDALRGFVSQKTDFAYEVLISDDASKDRTTDIIREYARKYPDLIKPMLLSENHFSKGIYPGTLLMEKAQGDYIAFCEGDDYWISEHKLQKQYDAMERHPECDMCAHSALKVRPEDRRTIGKIEPMAEDGILSMEKVIEGGGDFIATNSLFFRRSIIDSSTAYLKYSGYDYAYQMSGAERGGILYLKETMSAYRRGADSSWTLSMLYSKNDAMIRHIDGMMKMLDIANEETGHRFDKSICFAKSKYEFQKAVLQKNIKRVFSKEFASLRRDMSAKRKLILVLQCFAPWSLGLYQNVKKARKAKH